MKSWKKVNKFQKFQILAGIEFFGGMKLGLQNQLLNFVSSLLYKNRRIMRKMSLIIIAT